MLKNNFCFYILLFLFSMTLSCAKTNSKNTKKISYNSKAIFAGGCFWCMQPPFDQLKGVSETFVGYSGGKSPDPNYEKVSYGLSDHIESIQVLYNSNIITYRELINTFWRNINPTQSNGQFHDIGFHYQTAIFYKNQKEKEEANQSLLSLEKSGKFNQRIATKILPETLFYKAENYHQKYYLKNKNHYKRYKIGSGRASYLEKTWKNDSNNY